MTDLQKRISTEVKLESSTPSARTLTTQEADILQCMMDGMQRPRIALAVGLAEAAVKDHIKAILKKAWAEP
jgi:two-component system nitrate/nitrite response regulator NarL